MTIACSIDYLFVDTGGKRQHQAPHIATIPSRATFEMQTKGRNGGPTTHLANFSVFTGYSYVIYAYKLTEKNVDSLLNNGQVTLD